jgi:hypothetical protein
MSATELQTTPEEIARQAGRALELATPQHILEWAGFTFPDSFALTSSMGDAALLHMASIVLPGVPVIFLDTGYHFPEAIDTLDAVRQAYDIQLLLITPEQSVFEQDALYGAYLTRRIQTPAARCARSSRFKRLSRPTVHGEAAPDAMSPWRVAPPRSSPGTPGGRNARSTHWPAGQQVTLPSTCSAIASSSTPSPPAATRQSAVSPAHSRSHPALTREAAGGTQQDRVRHSPCLRHPGTAAAAGQR